MSVPMTEQRATPFLPLDEAGGKPPHRPLKYYFNANILTMNRAAPVAPHMLVAGDRVWFCNDGRVPLGIDFREPGFSAQRRALSPDVEFIDLDGKTVIPGITDAHVHFLWWALCQTHADLVGADSEEAAVAILRDYAKGRDLALWLVGKGWVHNLWTKPELPAKASLDAVFPDTPVFLHSKCGHLAWVNTAALKAAGLDGGAPDPPGGKLERITVGGVTELTGILKETAIGLVESRIPRPTGAAMREALLRGQAMAHSFGITSVHAPEESMDTWGFLQNAHAEGILRIRFGFLMPAEALDHAGAMRLRHGSGDDWLFLAGVKMFADGSLGGRTALMYEPHEGEPGNLGICVSDRAEITRRTVQANRMGMAMAVHAIGDKAVGDVLRAFETSAAKLGDSVALGTHPPVRNRIEHMQLFAPRDLERIRALRPVASAQPVHLCADWAPADRHWGKRSRHAYAFRSLAQAGCLLAFGSDAPVEPINPFLGMYAAVTRQGLDGAPAGGWHPEERIDAAAALAAYTTGPARAAGMQQKLGDLSPGKYADFVVLKEDPLQVAPGELRGLLPDETHIAGECVHRTGR